MKSYWVVEVTEDDSTFFALKFGEEAQFAEQEYAEQFAEEVLEHYESKGKEVSICVAYVSGGSNE